RTVLALCLLIVAFLMLCRSGAGGDQGLTKVEIAKIGKAATALVECKGRMSYGSSFCVHLAGLFITNAHVVQGDATVTLVLHPAEKNQKSFAAKVVRRDADLDLALLSIEGEKGLSALALGSADGIRELEDLVACGFPFGAALASEKGVYPAVSINTSSVTALRKKDGELYRIQLDGALNPGNSGGPVLDRNGKVVGVVVAGLPGAGINFAIPVSHVRRFVEVPDVQFTPPTISQEAVHQPALFEAKALAVLPSAKPLE